jgi:transposase
MANILNLPRWEVLETRTTDGGDHTVRAEYTDPPMQCTKCGVVNPKVYVHQYKDQLFHDVPHHGRKTALIVRRRRYACRDCEQVFTQELPDMHLKHRATQRLVKFVAENAMRYTFARVARESGFDERSVRRIFEDHIRELEGRVRFETPFWLGIDEVHLLKGARFVMANLREWTVIDMLDGIQKARVTQRLLDLPDRRRVELVALDMTRAYLDACTVALPQAVVIVDKFHVVKKASEALEAVRKDVRKGLNSRQRTQLMHDRHKLFRRREDILASDQLVMQEWFGKYPKLGEAYRAKEAFYDLYDTSPDSKEAKERLDAWRATLPQSVRAPFRNLLTSLTNWEPQILTYFDHKATNAPTEALSGAIKRMKSEGRGYSFDALRAKILFGKRPKTGPTSIRSPRVSGGMMGYAIPHTPIYGVSYDDIGSVDHTPEGVIQPPPTDCSFTHSMLDS